MTVSEFVERVTLEEDIIIYGPGMIGRMVNRYLQNNGIRTTAFMTTLPDEKKSVDGLEVYELDYVVRKYPTAFVIIAAIKLSYPEMEKNLLERNFENYIIPTEALICEMRAKVLEINAQRATSEFDVNTPEDDLVGYIYPGYMDTNYAEKRLIVDVNPHKKYLGIPKEISEFGCIGTEYEDNIDAYKTNSEACYCPNYYTPKVSYIHTFNMICKTDLKWCVSFETSLPRLQGGSREYREQLIDYMMRPNCKAMFALSGNAYNIQKRSLECYLDEQEVNLLMSKTKILHAPQPLLVDEQDILQRGKNLYPIRFIFIGRDFFIKGGKAIIDALSKFEHRYDFRLTLISSMKYNDFFTKTPYEEMVKYREIIMNKPWIDFFESLPNEDVLEKCKDANVGLLPSMAETYGYSVLEMQAAGLPVVTTNIRAFPELNSCECGWICNIPVNDLGVCTERNMTTLYNILDMELEKVFIDILENPIQIIEKGVKAWKHIREMHDPAMYAEQIEESMSGLHDPIVV